MWLAFSESAHGRLRANAASKALFALTGEVYSKGVFVQAVSMSGLACFTTRPGAIVSVANGLQKREDTRHALRRVFLNALRHSDARSTPKVPTFHWLNVAAEGQPDKFELRLMHVAITQLIGDMQDSHWFVEALCTSLRQIEIGTVRDAMVAEYVDCNLDQMIALGWTE